MNEILGVFLPSGQQQNMSSKPLMRKQEARLKVQILRFGDKQKRDLLSVTLRTQIFNLFTNETFILNEPLLALMKSEGGTEPKVN